MLLDLSPLRKYRDFRLVYFGQIVSFFGSMITYVAIPYQLFEITHSSFLVGTLGAVQLIPLLISAFWGGAYADAMDRRRLLIGSELILTLCSALLLLNSTLAHPSPSVMFVLAAVMSAVSGFHRPSLDALTQKLVEPHDMAAVSALGSVRFSLGAILGPAAGGVLIGKFGLGVTYGVDVATFLFSLIALARIQSMPPPENAERPGLNSIRAGIRYALSRPELVGTYLVDIIAMLFAMPMALFPSMAQGWGGAKAAGWLYSAMAIGSLVISLFSGWIKHVQRHGAAVILAATLWGLAVIALGFVHSLAFAIFWIALAGAADMISGMFRSTIWNQTIPNEMRGRLSGIEMISYMTGPLLGNLRAGWVASVSTNSFSIVSGGVLCVIGVLACIPLLPRFWHYLPGPHSKSGVG